MKKKLREVVGAFIGEAEVRQDKTGWIETAGGLITGMGDG